MYDPVGGDHFNIFATGLKMADRVVTVSHGYAWELKTSEGGWGLHSIINESHWKLRGIVNGIDMKDWNPQLDVHLTSDGYTNYSLDTLHAGKPQCKAALQNELGLPVHDDVPLIGFIGRLGYQKGIDLIAEAMPRIVGQDVQLVMLGTGRLDLEQMLRQFENQRRDKVRGWVGISVKMAYRITAGADILPVPSSKESHCPYADNSVHCVVGHPDNATADSSVYKPSHYQGFVPCGLGLSGRATSIGWRKWVLQWELTWDDPTKPTSAAQNYEEVLVAAKYQW
ncbi:hypothetical protein HYC85_015469 [Camellia sinensis]|uniref:Starch synthase catalytic domain-containing protein n=1 Tax=Camellia sinensis TaxID=4442 RepID=A0A7J7GZ43_CAMSI|nr:hypothetical protein HYC85_015469 [Camellia sinensis]